MNDLIYDAYSIFFQILQHFAPDYVGDYGFLLTGYAFSCLFMILVLWTLLQMLSAFSKAVIILFNRGVDK